MESSVLLQRSAEALSCCWLPVFGDSQKVIADQNALTTLFFFKSFYPNACWNLILEAERLVLLFQFLTQTEVLFTYDWKSNARFPLDFIRAASILKLGSNFAQSSTSESPFLMCNMATSSKESHFLLFKEEKSSCFSVVFPQT